MDETVRKVCDAAAKMKIPVSVADPEQPDCPLIFANRGFEDLTGYNAESLIGQNCRFLQGEDTDPENVSALGSAVRALQSHTCCLLNYRADGTPFHNLLFIEPVNVALNRVYLIGCQYQFDTSTDADQVTTQTHMVAETIINIAQAKKTARQFKMDALQMRSHAAFISIRTHLRTSNWRITG